MKKLLKDKSFLFSVIWCFLSLTCLFFKDQEAFAFAFLMTFPMIVIFGMLLSSEDQEADQEDQED